METNRNKSRVIFTAFAVLITIGAMSQGQQKMQNTCPEDRGFKHIPDLTDEQISKIDELRTVHLEKMMKQKAKAKILQAELRELEIADNADMNKINGKIDEISVVRTTMIKDRSAHRQDIRKILTKEQRLYFDNHMAQGRSGFHKGKHGCKNECGTNKGHHNGQRQRRPQIN
jgi:Spy/CpxP family protein refolding chaperone